MALVLSPWKAGQFAGSTSLAQNTKICPWVSHRRGLARLPYNGRRELAAALPCSRRQRACGLTLLARVPAQEKHQGDIHPPFIELSQLPAAERANQHCGQAPSPRRSKDKAKGECRAMRACRVMGGVGGGSRARAGGRLFSECVGRSSAGLAATQSMEGEEGLEQGRRNCKNHFRKETRPEEQQTPRLGSQAIKHGGS